MIDDLRDGWTWYHNPYQFLDQALQERGLTFPLRLPVLGQTLVTGEPALIGEMMRSKTLMGGRGITVLRSILGEQSMITLTGPAHRERRRLIYPFLHGPAIRRYDNLIVELSQGALDCLPPGQPFSVYELVRSITLKSMIQVIFGGLSADEATEAEGLIEAFLSSFQNALILFLKPLHLDLGNWSPWGRAKRRRDQLLAFIFQQIDRCQQRDEPSLLARMVAEAGALSREALAAEVLALLLFGLDTGAATLAWACAFIYRKPALVARLRAEVTGTDNPEDMPFLAACLNETMRLSPVVVHLTRVAATETCLGAQTLPAGQVVIPCTYLAQHNPAVFPEPYEFRPERFLDKKIDPQSFFPFGFGSRTCAGKGFALRQMRLILATLLRRETLRLAPGYEPRPVRQMVLIIPQAGTLMIKEA